MRKAKIKFNNSCKFWPGNGTTGLAYSAFWNTE